ncbi:flagellin [Lautropia mirabilis]|uniref:flagellin N-terminal helical domain-containing protein n=1 Tax=Lautropia mirabilis TaxID=47671 RepID=UPI002889C940|nr:flagellin [Lautropia mirabilis]
MAQIINTNLMSLNAQRNLSTTQSALATSVQRLSTGLRVNSAKDDAAGLAIAERMNTQVRGMNVAVRNANDAISLAQTAEGALSKINDMGQRMRELAVQSANATNNETDRESLDAEFQALSAEIKRNLEGTSFNGTKLFAALATMTFQVGANNATTDQIAVVTTNLTTDTTMTGILGGGGGATAADIKNVDKSREALDKLDKMLATVNSKRAEFGATQNRFEAVIQTLQVSAENQTAARSRIMDADFASETAALTRAQVLQQAGTAMLSQANSLPNNVLSLLR